MQKVVETLDENLILKEEKLSANTEGKVENVTFEVDDVTSPQLSLNECDIMNTTEKDHEDMHENEMFEFEMLKTSDPQLTLNRCYFHDQGKCHYG